MILVAQRRTAEQEIACCEKELAAYEARTELLPLSRDLNVRRVALAEQEIKKWQEIVNQQRQQDAEQQARQAAWEVGQADPAVRQLVEYNVKLAEMRKSLAAHIVDATRQLAQINQELTDLKDQFARVREKVEVAEKTNTSNTVGLLLRKLREGLPNLRAHRRNVGVRQETMGEGELARLELLNDRSALADLDLRTQQVLQQLQGGQQGGNRAESEVAVREALQTERDYLDALTRDHDTYYKKLADLTIAEKELIDQTETCARYIDERVLWIGSAAPLAIADVNNAPARRAGGWLGLSAWVDLGRTLAADAGRNPAISALALGLFAMLFYWRMRFRARLQEMGEKAARGNCCHFLPTLETAALSTLIAAGWPGLMWYLGWRLTAAADASELCRAVGAGLTETARVFLALELLRQICCTARARRVSFRLVGRGDETAPAEHPLVQSAGVAADVRGGGDGLAGERSLGRLAGAGVFHGGAVVFSLALHRVLRPGQRGVSGDDCRPARRLAGTLPLRLVSAVRC